jgi:amidophosphoribosyltransferase
MVVIDAGGLRSLRPFEPPNHGLCIFEFVYFARPDSQLYGAASSPPAGEMGGILADEHPAVPTSWSRCRSRGSRPPRGSPNSGIPYADGLVKNRYVGRTFIEPTQMLRDRDPPQAQPDPRDLGAFGGARRRLDRAGSTTRQLVTMVREAGAREVHLRISSPPYRWPCFYGMDTSDRAR